MAPESSRGRIVPPDLDDRTWQDLVDEMRALIPKYAPQWTDHNPSDLGITLIELFAWLVEGLIYRLNQRRRRTTSRSSTCLASPAIRPTPARTYLTFTPRAQSGHRARRHPGADRRPGRRAAGGLRDRRGRRRPAHRPDGGARRRAVRRPGDGSTYVSADLVGPPTAPPAELRPARPSQLCFGFDQAVTADVPLRVRLYHPARPAGPVTAASVYSTGTTSRWPGRRSRRVRRDRRAQHDGASG